MKLTNEQMNALEHLASVSKMDCWFYIDEQGNIRDLENNNCKMNKKIAITMLLEGATDLDYENVGELDAKILQELEGIL